MGLARCVQRPRVLLALFGAAVIGGALLYALVIQLLTVVWKVNGEAQYIVLVYNPLLRYSEFFAGCVAGHWFLGRVARGGAVTASRQWQRDLLIGACLAAVALRIWMPDYTGPSREIWLFDVAVKYAAFIVPFGVLIVAIASGPSWLSPLLRQPWLVMLGEASYALYIVHWSVTSFLRLGSLGRWSTPAAHLACLLATVGVSVLVYRHIELPWRERLRGGSRPAAALPATTVAIP
jgi:peptidoglycan/LPS O-acetylase OafA/YrhL